MAADSDTLTIGALRVGREHEASHQVHHVPARQPDPAIHPDAAAAARERIAAIHAHEPVINNIDAVPAMPTADLITNKTALAQIASTQPIVASQHQHSLPSVNLPSRELPSIVRPMLTAVGIFLLTLLLFKAPIILSQIQYNFSQKSPNAATAAAVAAPVSSADTVSVPKINVSAPVQYISSTNETDIETALESGVIHYSTTALPGQNGNVAIFGHSSNDWWQPGNYKFVFVLLDKLSPGDLVYLNYNSVRYTYQVTDSKVVQPTDMSVLGPTSTPTLSLITCTPPGTSLERLVVTAKQISPDPNSNSTSTPAATPASGGSLPSAAPSFMTQVTDGINSVVQSFEALFGGNPSNSTSSSGSGSQSGTQNQLPATQ